MGLREQKREKLVEDLLRATLRLVKKQGFEETTIAQISAEAFISPRTFARYFPAKEDVVVSRVAEVMAVLTRELGSRPSLESNKIAIRKSLQAMLAAYEAEGPLMLEIEKIIATSPEVAARKARMVEGLIDQVAAALQSRSDQNFGAVEAQILAGVTIAIARSTIRAWIASDGSEVIENLLRQAGRVVSIR